MRIAAPNSGRRLKPSLTPMIDVVFLLLVFFMLAAQFAREGQISVRAASATGATQPADYNGPPRLIGLTAEGLSLNGAILVADDLVARLTPLMADLADPVVLRVGEGVRAQAMVDLVGRLQTAGIDNIVLLEATR